MFFGIFVYFLFFLLLWLRYWLWQRQVTREALEHQAQNSPKRVSENLTTLRLRSAQAPPRRHDVTKFLPFGVFEPKWSLDHGAFVVKIGLFRRFLRLPAVGND